MSFAKRYGPWAIITGASEGTGRQFAKRIAAQGVSCILIARREGPLSALADEIRSDSGVECVTARIDLYSSDAFAGIIEAVGKREVGLYVANAGADPNSSRFLDVEIDAWIRHINRSVITTVRCSHHFGDLMRNRGRGGILLVGSGACYGGASFLATYSAGKAFELCFSEGLWAELRPHGVDVLCLVLTRTDTPALRTFLEKNNLPAPDGLASTEEVARVGLERLPYGPVHNFGQEDEDLGYASNTAADRRARVLFIDEATKGLFADG